MVGIVCESRKNSSSYPFGSTRPSPSKQGSEGVDSRVVAALPPRVCMEETAMQQLSIAHDEAHEIEYMYSVLVLSC